MNNEIKEILEKPNVYSFYDECYLYFGDYNKLKDYITNLQEENERLKNDIEDISVSHFSLFKQYEDYKSRNKKAIEYINNNTYYKTHKGTINIDDLYIILNGGDEE